MCCKYYYTPYSVMKTINELELQEREDMMLPEGEISPSCSSLIIIGQSGRLILDEAKWGFPGKGGGLIINARSETALTKPMFSSSVLNRRCVVPAEKFWEWDSLKEKVEFKDPAGELMYLAGFWNIIENVARFVVMTAAANASVISVHDRMPLIISRSDVRSWLLDQNAFQSLMSAQMPPLVYSRQQEQLSMF